MSTARGGHARVYRSLLRVYPADYREGYGEQMVQLFGDQLRDAGPAQTWLRTAADLPTSAASEHLRRNRTVAHSVAISPTPVSRLLGLLGVLGGALLLVAFVIEIEPGVNSVRVILFLVGVLAVVVGVHRQQALAAPRLALLAAVPALAGFAWLLAMEVLLLGSQPPLFGGSFGVVFFWASLAAWMGAAWFGLLTFWLGVVTRIGSLAVAVGFLLAMTGIDRLGLVSAENPTIFNTLSLMGLVLGGLGCVLLGLDVAIRRRPAAGSGSEGAAHT